jgi:hypothetical protein
MERFYLIDTIAGSRKPRGDLLDLMKYELDQRIYYYGGQFRSPWEASGTRYPLARQMRKVAASLVRRVAFERSLRQRLPQGKRVLSNAYFSANAEMRRLGYAVLSPPWGGSTRADFLPNREAFDACRALGKIVGRASFVDLLAESTAEAVKAFADALRQAVQSVDAAALVVPNDAGMWERLAIREFRKMGRPSFVFLHGLPGRYNRFDEGRTDYLVVWGERIRKNYIQAGHDPKRVLVSGHPYYRDMPASEPSHSLEDVLVLTKSMNGAQHSEEVVLTDRGNLAAYLYFVQEALESLGVRRARLRPHPVENGDWYRGFLDMGFYALDREGLPESLRRSSLVIGPASTVMLESLYHGVFYQVFEPVSAGRCMDNYPAVPPFDGSDPRLPVAKDTDGLARLLKSGGAIDPSFWAEYVRTPFSLDFMKGIV